MAHDMSSYGFLTLRGDKSCRRVFIDTISMLQKSIEVYKNISIEERFNKGKVAKNEKNILCERIGDSEAFSWFQLT